MNIELMSKPNKDEIKTKIVQSIKIRLQRDQKYVLGLCTYSRK